MLGASEDADVDDDVDEELRGALAVRKEIRVSPQKLNLLAKQIRGMDVSEALLQMKYSKKRHAAIVSRVLQNAINVADIDHEIAQEDLVVRKAFVGKGRILKRIKMMAKGRFGQKWRRHSHLYIDVRERSQAEVEQKKRAESHRWEGDPKKPCKEYAGKMLSGARKGQYAVRDIVLDGAKERVQWSPMPPPGLAWNTKVKRRQS